MFRFISIIFLLSFTLFASSSNNLNFSKEEKDFISKNKVITYVYDPNWAPFEWENGISEHVGMIADILKIIAKKSGLKFQASSSNSWPEAIRKLEKGEVVMASGLTMNKARLKHSNFTKHMLFSVPYVFVTRNNNYYQNGFKSLKRSKLAFVQGYAIKGYLLDEHPEMKFETVSNLQEGFLKLLDNRIDALLINQASAQYEIKEHGYNQLSISYKTKYTLPLKIAVNKKFDKVILSIIDKTIASIPKEEIHRIYDKYTVNPKVESKVSLTHEEKKWITSHPSIRFVGDPNWLPFEGFNTNGEYIGIVAEYLKKIQKITGLHFQIMRTKTWEKSVNLMKTKQADIISETVDSDMGETLDFTDAYLENHIVILMQSDSRYVDDLSVVKDKKIAVIKGYGYIPKIKKAYPCINFIEVDNINEGLESLAKGKIDALLCTMALGSYHISRGGYGNIRIVGKTEFSTKIGFGVQPEMKLLVNILNKAITILENGKKQEILQKWTLQKYIEKIDYTLAWQVLFAAVLLLSLFIYWTTRMKKEITRRIQAEQEQQKMLVQQAKMAAMGEMIDSIAHQWKQPLNAISMLSELAEMDFEEGIVDKKYMKEYKGQIFLQTSHLLSTLNEFRNFFRPSTKVSVFDAKKALESLLLLVKDEFLKNTIEVTIREQDKLSLKGVENEFKHIILNIINNAKDAFNENNVQKRKVTFSLYLRGEVKCIEVKDNAGGIPSSIIKDIFKANVTSKAEGKGTGIGLYMSDQIAKKMHAKLSVMNQGSGAVFLLEI